MNRLNKFVTITLAWATSVSLFLSPAASIQVLAEKAADTKTSSASDQSSTSSSAASDTDDDASAKTDSTEENDTDDAELVPDVQEQIDGKWLTPFSQANDYQDLEDGDIYEDVVSETAALVDLSRGKVVAGHQAETIIYPASMTKIMTVLVACENLKGSNLTDTFAISNDILDYCAKRDASTIGFSNGERVTVLDLLYATILPSGADGAIALGRYIAGSDVKFVQMMNQKAVELGLTKTHFTNCVGLYDKNNFTTPEEMASILYAASQNQLAWTILSTRQYTTLGNTYHSDGITVNNKFLTRMQEQSLKGKIMSAKTGFVSQSGFCAASYFISSSGTPYILVTGKSDTSAQCIQDQRMIYNAYTK